VDQREEQAVSRICKKTYICKIQFETFVMWGSSQVYSEWQRIFIAKISCCFRQMSAWLNWYILPLRIQKDVCGTFNKFYLSLKSKCCKFKSSIALYIYVKTPIFKMSCFYNNPSGKPRQAPSLHRYTHVPCRVIGKYLNNPII
jgi:hypothetical protein